MIEIEVTATDVRRAAMDLLARREHSKQELQQKLGKKFSACPELVEEAVRALDREGLQDDSRMAEAFTRARVSKGQGPLKIRMELRQKGIDDELISVAFEQSDIDWFALADQVATKKFGSLETVDLKLKGKLFRFLQQRGFTYDHISNLA